MPRPNNPFRSDLPSLNQRPATLPRPQPAPAQAAPSPEQAQWDRLMSHSTGRGRAARAESELYLGPDAISNDTNRLFELMVGSPMFQNMMRGLIQSGSQMNTGFQSALGRTGLSSSGVGAASGALAKSATGNAIQGARGDMFAQALQTALQALQSRMQMAPTFMEERRAGPSFMEGIGGQLLGGAASAIPGAGTAATVARGAGRAASAASRRR
jgi:hypothetical protein